MKTLLVVLITFFSLSARDTILIVTEHLPPFQYAENCIVTAGVSYDLVAELMSRSGDAYSLKAYSWEQAYSLGLKRENVMIFSLTHNEEREPLFKWIGKITTLEDYFWRLKTSDSIVVNSVEDAKRYKTAVPREDIQHITLRNKGFVENKNMFLVRDMNQSVRMLYLGRIDLIIGPELVIAERTKELKLKFSDLEKVIPLGSAKGGIFIAFSTATSDSIVQRYRELYEEMIDDGTHKRVLGKWIPGSSN